MEISTHRKIIIITAPSGAGKSTITHYLLTHFPNLSFSISAATRLPRGAEVNGKDYHFMTENDFLAHIQSDDFVEWEMVYEGKYYGTLKTEIYRIWDADKTPVLDIDVSGALHIKQAYPKDTLTIFIEPPSIDVLKDRLASRGTETPESLATRVNKAAYELSFKHQFDKVILNDHLEKACNEAAEIISTFLSN